MDSELKQKFLCIVKKDEELVNLLKIVKNLNLSDSFIAAGAIRNLIWDSLHNYKKRTPLSDVDVVYFDSSDITPEKDLRIWEKLSKIEPNVNWNVFNQARSHIKNKSGNQVYSTQEGIAYWSETSTCIGVRLNEDNSFSICAPHGISDLMNLIVRPIPEPYQDLELYNKRISEKNWKKTWPKLQIILS